MADLVVVNSGPLIAFSTADLLEVIGRLPFAYICPPQVRSELDAGVALGRPPIAPGWLRTIALAKPLDPLAIASLDEGEAAVIQLAQEQGNAIVCLDDARGRRAAMALGLPVTGSLGLLIRAQRAGLLAAIKPVLDTLQRNGRWYRSDVIADVLAAVGEWELPES